MKKIILFTVIATIGVLLYGCSEKEIENTSEPKIGAIYGKITDYKTGEPVADANVSLQPGKETTLTGYDGLYEFYNIEDGDYYITVSKAEYPEIVDNYTIKVRNGQRTRHDVQIKKQIEDLRITDMDGNNINFLDFGNEPTTVVRSFNIFNNGTVNISCNLVYSCVWIKSVSSVPSTIHPGQTVPVSVEIDRTKLVAGTNSTTLYINSNNGNNILEIRAIGQENLPVVRTLPVTQVDGTIGPLNDVFHGEVTNVGYPPYTKRGFCWSITNSTPTVNDNNIEVEGNGPGEYSYYNGRYWWDNPPTTRVTFYVRAWVKYGQNNTIIYGNVQPSAYNDW